MAECTSASGSPVHRRRTPMMRPGCPIRGGHRFVPWSPRWPHRWQPMRRSCCNRGVGIARWPRRPCIGHAWPHCWRRSTGKASALRRVHPWPRKPRGTVMGRRSMSMSRTGRRRRAHRPVCNGAVVTRAGRLPCTMEGWASSRPILRRRSEGRSHMRWPRARWSRTRWSRARWPRASRWLIAVLPHCVASMVQGMALRRPLVSTWVPAAWARTCVRRAKTAVAEVRAWPCSCRRRGCWMASPRFTASKRWGTPAIRRQARPSAATVRAAT
mmetsp:Transcript_14486/g.31785  ORF Transcript_14486/g.31785 Transcript_14486/m.31785 type:complete len:270 (+) Transcript_14486:75-884(+)